MNIFKNKILIFLVIIIAIGVIFAGSKFSAKKEVKPVVLTKVSMALDWFPNSDHAELFIAKERGYFVKEGLDVDLHTPADPSTVLQTVASGRDDLGMSPQLDVLIARGKGIKIVSIIGLVQHPLNSIMALKSSGITQPKELVGKKVGGTGIPDTEPLLDTMLKSQGKSIKDVELVNVGFDLVPALISKKVDAIIGAFWTSESISAENQGFPVNIMRMEKYGVPDYYELVLVTNEDKIGKDSDLIQRFVRATKKGYEDAIADPQGAVRIMKKLKPEVDLVLESKSVDLLAPLWVPENKVFGWQEEKRWEDFAKWMKENNLLGKDVDAHAAFNNSFVENAK